MKKIIKAISAAAILSFLCGLSGCGKPTEYTIDDIRSVSISCGHMDYSRSYSFYIRKAETEWLLDAEFAADTEQSREEYEACSIAEEDVKELLGIVREQNAIGKLRRYKKPKINVLISDETIYYTSILFADGKKLDAATLVSNDLEDFFYGLAEKYADTIQKTDNTQTNIEEE